MNYFEIYIEIFLHNLNRVLIYTHNSFLKSMKKGFTAYSQQCFQFVEYALLNGLVHLVPLLVDQELYISDEVIKRRGIFFPQGEYS